MTIDEKTELPEIKISVRVSKELASDVGTCLNALISAADMLDKQIIELTKEREEIRHHARMLKAYYQGYNRSPEWMDKI